MIATKRLELVRFPSTRQTRIGDRSPSSYSVILALTGLPPPGFSAHQPGAGMCTVVLNFALRPGAIRVGMAGE